MSNRFAYGGLYDLIVLIYFIFIAQEYLIGLILLFLLIYLILGMVVREKEL